MAFDPPCLIPANLGLLWILLLCPLGSDLVKNVYRGGIASFCASACHSDSHYSVCSNLEGLVAHFYESRHVHIYVISSGNVSVLIHLSPLVSPHLVCDEYISHLILNLWRLSVATTTAFPVQHQTLWTVVYCREFGSPHSQLFHVTAVAYMC